MRHGLFFQKLTICLSTYFLVACGGGAATSNNGCVSPNLSPTQQSFNITGTANGGLTSISLNATTGGAGYVPGTTNFQRIDAAGDTINIDIVSATVANATVTLSTATEQSLQSKGTSSAPVCITGLVINNANINNQISPPSISGGTICLQTTVGCIPL